MVRKPRRLPYAKLRERLWESQLPWDDRAERQAIGAVLLAPNGHAKRLARRAYSGHFYDKGHAWLWEELGLALVRCKLDLDSAEQIRSWLAKSEIMERFMAQFGGNVRKEIAACLDIAWWWHGDRYVDRVIEAAKVRSRVMVAAENFSKAMDAADEWRLA